MTTLLLGVLLAAAPARAAAPAAPEAAAQDRAYEELKLLLDVLGLIEDNYVEPVAGRDLVRGAAAGMARSLDPFSEFLDPEEYKEMRTETEGQFGGIGIRMASEDGWLTVQTPLPGSPAYRLGILPNDRLVEIDGEPAKDLGMSDALRRLRGAPGTKVRLALMRPAEGAGDWKRLEFEVTREIVKIETVQSLRLEGGAGCLRLSEFSARTAADAAKAAARLRAEGAKGLILDLRNNPGGLLGAAVEVASLFIGEGKLLVYTQGRAPESRQDFFAGKKAPHADLPLAVLINEGSASGSEIVAGALQDHRRAVVIGERSFGKGSVQSVIPLADGSGLRLTVARYYTPSGRSIHREPGGRGGIVPDIEVPVSQEDETRLYAQWDLLYAKDRKPRSAVKPEAMVRDAALERAAAELAARGAAPPPAP